MHAHCDRLNVWSGGVTCCAPASRLRGIIASRRRMSFGWKLKSVKGRHDTQRITDHHVMGCAGAASITLLVPTEKV